MSDDDDLAFALFLQEQFNNENGAETEKSKTSIPTKSMGIVDEAWELIDPVPDIRQMFLQFNDEYFSGQLGGVEVRWSPRMTLCAGLCCYEGRGGLCSIRLSAPLLKLRPRKDLVQTLLHEMIHALLYVTQNNKDHDGHGPEFHKHMYRINKQTGTNITVYHNFHDEVDACRQHWWKCNGPCQRRPPFYGVVKRSMNRAPAPRDTWWAEHQAKCGGTFTKIKEPENYGKKKTKSKENAKGSKVKENTAGPSKGKGKVNWSKGTPSLPSLFERIKDKNNAKKDSDDLGGPSSGKKDDSVQIPRPPKIPDRYNGSNRSRDAGGTSERSKVMDIDDTDAKMEQGVSKDNTSDRLRESEEESNFENNAKRRKTDDADTYPVIIPFSGKGHVLGAGNNNSDKNTKAPTTDNKNKKGMNVSQSNTSIPRLSETSGTVTARKHGDLSPTGSKTKGSRSSTILTIEDAFKRGTDRTKTSVVSTPIGSKDKPIMLSDSPMASQSSTSNVACPVCEALMPATQMNIHLDSCLMAE